MGPTFESLGLWHDPDDELGEEFGSNARLSQLKKQKGKVRASAPAVSD